MELTRNLADILPKDHARDSTALKVIDTAQVRWYNCGNMGHFSNECLTEETRRSKEAKERAAARCEAARQAERDRVNKEKRVNAIKEAADKKDKDKDKDNDDKEDKDEKKRGRRSRSRPS